jgi:hypothetical protein
MKTIKECVEERGTGLSFTRKEKNKRFTIESNKSFYCEVVKIDGCVMKDGDMRRCDYLFLTGDRSNNAALPKPHKAFYVELKGDDVKAACEQLYNAIYHTKNGLLRYEIVAKVVTTKDFHPNLRDNKFYRDLRKLIKREIDFHKVHKGNQFHYRESIEI